MSADIHSSHDQIRAAVNISWGAIYHRDLATAELWAGRAPRARLIVGDRFVRCVRDRRAGADRRDEGQLGGNRSEGLLCSTPWLNSARRTSSPAHCSVDFRLAEVVHQDPPDGRVGTLLQANEVQRTTPAAISLAEYVWIGGKLDEAIFPQMREILADCIDCDSPWMAGELGFWLRLIGEIDHIPEIAPEPYRLAGDGDWEGAAAFWKERGIPYDRAVALSHGDTDARIEALGIFDDLGAIPVAARLRSELAEAG